MKQNITLKSLQKFQCLAGECPDSCCSTYDIMVDDATVTSWRNSTASNKLLSLIEKKQEHDNYILQKTSNGDCVALTNTGLCSIQQEFGHEALPQICQLYPRYKKENQWRVLKSLAFSCPEVVSLTLFRNIDGAEFEGQRDSKQVANLFTDPFQQASIWLDQLTNEVMGHDKFPVNVKLFFIGQTLSELYQAIDTGQLNQQLLTRLSKNIKQRLYDINLACKQRRIKPDPITTGSLWHMVFRLYCDNPLTSAHADIMSSALYRYCEKEFVSNEEYLSFYKIVHDYAEKSRPEIRKRYANVFNNYLKISFLNWGFPWEPMMENHIAGFLCVFIPYSMVQILLWTKYAETGCIDDEYVIETIYIVERICGHNEKMLAMLNENSELQQMHNYYSTFIEMF